MDDGRDDMTQTRRATVHRATVHRSSLLAGAVGALMACAEPGAAEADAQGDAAFSSDVNAPSNGRAPRAPVGWSQYRTDDGICGLRWHAPRIEFKTDSRGLRDVPQGTFEATVRTALQSWQSTTCSVCTSPQGPSCPPVACAPQPLGLELALAGSATATAAGAVCTQRSASGTCTAVNSNGNFYISVQDAAQWHYGVGVVGLTKLTFNHADGGIADADVLLNDVHQSFSPASLCYTLTHETGHVLGLDHSPNADATMYMSGVKATCGLHADDRLGACHAYRTRCGGAAAACQGAATTDDKASGGCGVGRLPTAGWAALVFVGALWLRRFRPARRTPGRNG